MYTGSCLCGSIQFNIVQIGPTIAHCHCNMCQKFHGAAFSTFADVERKHFDIITGENLISHYTAENKTVRSFCKTCGSSLFFESEYNRKDNTIEVSIACLDHVTDLNIIKPDAHIFTEFKVKWYELTDSLPQHKNYRS